MSIHFVDRVCRFAGRLFQSASRPRCETRARSLRIEPLEQRRLLAMFVSNATPEGYIQGYNATNGASLGNFAQIQSNGGYADNYYPEGFTFGPNGNLYVDTGCGGTVEEFNGTTGALINAGFVNGGSGGPNFMGGIAFGPDGNLYVGYSLAVGGCGVSEYNGATGKYIQEFIADYNITNTPSLYPEALAFGADGNLYMAAAGTSQLYCFYGPASPNAGQTVSGFPVKVDPSNSQVGDAVVSSMGGMVFGPNGDLYMSVTSKAVPTIGWIEKYSSTGQDLGVFVAAVTGNFGGAGKLTAAGGLAFDPDNGDLYVINNNEYETTVGINEYSPVGKFITSLPGSDTSEFASIVFHNVPPVANSTTVTAAGYAPVNVNLGDLVSDYETPHGDLTFAAGTGTYAPGNCSINVNGDNAVITPSAAGGQATAYYSVTDQENGGLPNTVYAEITVDFSTATLTFASGSGEGVYGGTTTATITLTCGGQPIPNAPVAVALGGGTPIVVDTNASGVATADNINLAGWPAGNTPEGVSASFGGYAGGSSTQNYPVAANSTSLIVSPAPLTITADDQSKVYGAALPSLTVAYAGFVNGDTPASLATRPTVTTTATAASHVAGNPYTITAAGAASPNYTISYLPGTLTVTAAPLTITANNQTKVYGAALPPLTASYAGFVNGDTPASLATRPKLSTTATAASHVAGNPYTITAAGATDPDYTISYLPGALTVTPAPLTITANNQTKVYGAALPPLTASYAGLVNGDTPVSLTVQPTLTTTATAASHVAGNPYRITATGAADSDYTISYLPGALTVTAAPLTITANNQTKVYGAALPSLTVAYAGLVNGDTPASFATQPKLSTTATAASHVAGNPYTITAAGATDRDYTISYLPGTLTVTPAPLTITAVNKIMLTGKPVPALTATYTGLVNGDTPASLSHAPQLSTPATSQSLCGQYPINISGAADTDYTITQNPGALWIITAVGEAIWAPVDPINPTKSLLIVSGTAANETVQINPGSTAGSVTVIFDGKSLGTFSPTSRICVYGGGGNDTISVSQQVTVPAWLYTENGNVQLMGGGGPTLLMGGPGKDTLWGGSGPAIMIGGSGSNSLLAGSGGAVLVGGATAYDDNPAALQQILGTWSSSSSYATRVSQLMSDPTYPLDAATVFAGNAVDSLFGGPGADLFFQSPGDNLTNVRPDETVVAVG